MTQTTVPPSPTGPPPGPKPPGGRAWPIAAIVLGVLAAVLAVVLVIVANDDDDADVAVEDTTTTVEETTTTTEEETSTTTSTTTAGQVTDEEAANVAWPAPNESTYDEPLPLVEDFAVDVLGFADPEVGEYQQGDSRSGEVEVRADEAGPVTVVAVRQLGDDRFYALFAAATTEVELTVPTAATAIDHPLAVEGRGRGFEGVVRIAVLDRAGTVLGEGQVTAGGTGEVAPFTGSIDWENPGGGWGIVLATTERGSDGSTWAATAIPVGFIGGD